MLADDGLAEDVIQEVFLSVWRDPAALVATVVARDEVQVLVHGLEVNDAGSTTHVLRGLGRMEPEALGTFDVERSQMSLRTVGSGLTGLDDFAQYGISIEPGQKPSSEPAGVVAIGQVTS